MIYSIGITIIFSLKYIHVNLNKENRISHLDSSFGIMWLFRKLQFHVFSKHFKWLPVEMFPFFWHDFGEMLNDFDLVMLRMLQWF